MAGYSGTHLAKKLGIMPGALLLVVNEPAGMERWLAPLPEGVMRAGRRTKPQSVDIILCFARSAQDVGKRLDGLMAALKRDGAMWIAWPKKAAQKADSGLETDLSEDLVRARGLAAGLVDNKVCAINNVWSGLRFVYRRRDR